MKVKSFFSTVLIFSTIVSGCAYFHLSNYKSNDDSPARGIASSSEETNLAQEERQFLIRLGFSDYPAEAQITLNQIESGKIPASDTAQAVLKDNVERFKMIPASRELAILFRLAIERSQFRGEEKAMLDKLTTLAGYHLLPFPLIGLEPIPNSIYNGKMGDAAKKLRDDYLTEQSKKRYQIEVQALFNALSEGLYTQVALRKMSKETKNSLNQINDTIQNALSYQYEYSALQQSRYLGRALTATLLRYARQKNLSEYEARLDKMLAEEKIFLGNHVSSNLQYYNRKNEVVSVKVYNGDIANEFSTGPEAYQITVGVLPKSEGNIKTASDLKLLSNILYLPAMVYNPLVEYAAARKKQNYPLTEDQERALNQMWDENLIHGFSHAGIADVRKDEKSGIEMVWIWDVYPFASLGSTRFQTPENFAYSERYNRIGFVHYNAEKLLKHFQDSYRKSGYKENVWESFASKVVLDKSGDPAIELDRSRRVQRKNYLDNNTAEKWMRYTPQQAQNWYDNEVVPRALAMARRFLTSNEALTFSHGFKNRESSAYCTQFVLFAYLQGAQLDMQKTPDEWSSLVKMITKMGLGDYEINDRIISPSGFAWQKDLIDGKPFFVNFSRSHYNSQIQSQKPTVIEKYLNKLAPLNVNSIMKAKADLNLEELDFDDDDL